MACFTPEAPPPSKNGESDEGEPSDFPYSEIYMSAMDMGFSTHDLRTMSWARLVFFLRVKTNSIDRRKKAEEKRDDDVRDATQADIVMLF